MRNLFKHEAFKLFRSKALWISLVVAVVMQLVFVGLMQLVSSIEIPMGDDAVFSIPGMTGISGIQYAASDLLLILAAVLIAGIICIEYQKGVMRNLVMSGVSRWKIFLTKFIMSLAVTFAMFFVMAFITSALFTAFNGFGKFDWNVDTWIILNTLIQITSVVALTVLVAELTRSIGATIGISIGLYFVSSIIMSIGMFVPDTTLASVLEFIGDMYPGLGMVAFANPMAASAFTMARFIRLTIIAVCSIAVYFTAALLLFKKRDLK
jgi:ABC-type transport system involved in multi-copper enzyme maturation permease subunit